MGGLRLARAYAEAIYRKGLRCWYGRTLRYLWHDPYSTMPRRLSEAERVRVEEIMRRHRG